MRRGGEPHESHLRDKDAGQRSITLLENARCGKGRCPRHLSRCAGALIVMRVALLVGLTMFAWCRTVYRLTSDMSSDTTCAEGTVYRC